MTGVEFTNAALRTADGEKARSLLNGVLGLCGESGEVADLVKKSEFQGHELYFEQVAEELSDCLWYIAITANAIGYTLDDIMQINVDKLMKRYPYGFDSDRSVNREKYEAEASER